MTKIQNMSLFQNGLIVIKQQSDDLILDSTQTLVSFGAQDTKKYKNELSEH